MLPREGQGAGRSIGKRLLHSNATLPPRSHSTEPTKERKGDGRKSLQISEKTEQTKTRVEVCEMPQ